MPILFNEPSYLSSRPRRHAQRGTYPPSNLNSIAAFVRAAVRWYGPNGTFWTKHPTVPKLPIRIWQVWNEPNLNVYWLPRPSASHYVTLLVGRRRRRSTSSTPAPRSSPAASPRARSASRCSPTSR